jgi:hypothetical protein
MQPQIKTKRNTWAPAPAGHPGRAVGLSLEPLGGPTVPVDLVVLRRIHPMRLRQIAEHFDHPDYIFELKHVDL